jgi:hypothetical protein
MESLIYDEVFTNWFDYLDIAKCQSKLDYVVPAERANLIPYLRKHVGAAAVPRSAGRL